jgi:hypothetical protein
MKPAQLKPVEALSAAIACEITPERLSRVLSDALAADQVNRDGTRSPDFRTRLSALEIVLNRTIGTASKADEVTTVNPDANEGDKLAERLARSPALRRSLARLLAAHAKDEAIDATEV